MRYGDEFGFFELNPFPGCNQIVVSNHAFIYPTYRGQGYGQMQHHDRLAQAMRLGYDAVLCTVDEKNVAEIHILTKNDWKRLTQVAIPNVQTGHNVDLWLKRLR